MTVTTNELGQQNLFAKEPQMYVSKSDAERYGYETYAERAEKLNGRTAMLGFVAALISYATTGSVFFFGLFGFWLMENSILEILTYYVIGGALLIGAPGIFFLIVFMPALQNTKGRMVGYKDHKTYGDSSIYENSPSDNSKFYLTLENV